MRKNQDDLIQFKMTLFIHMKAITLFTAEYKQDPNHNNYNNRQNDEHIIDNRKNIGRQKKHSNSQIRRDGIRRVNNAYDNGIYKTQRQTG